MGQWASRGGFRRFGSRPICPLKSRRGRTWLPVWLLVGYLGEGSNGSCDGLGTGLPTPPAGRIRAVPPLKPPPGMGLLPARVPGNSRSRWIRILGRTSGLKDSHQTVVSAQGVRSVSTTTKKWHQQQRGRGPRMPVVKRQDARPRHRDGLRTVIRRRA